MISDIAAIYHWSLSDLQNLDFDELIYWRDRAVASWNAMRGQTEN